LNTGKLISFGSALAGCGISRLAVRKSKSTWTGIRFGAFETRHRRLEQSTVYACAFPGAALKAYASP